MAERLELFMTTERGFEAVAADEVEELTGRKPEAVGEGRLLLKGSAKDVLLLNYCSNTLHRVVLLLLREEVETLEEVYSSALSVPFEELIAPEQSFAVRAERIGEHEFTSPEIAARIGQAVIDRYRRERGHRLRVNLKEPGVVIRAELSGRLLWLGVDTTGRSLHRRGYRAYLHPAPLKPTAAHALLRLAEWRHSEALIDPFCGSGTVCIEAVRWAWRMPNMLRKSSFLLWRLRFLPVEQLSRVAEEAEAGMRRRELKVRGCDISPKHLQGARVNARCAGIAGAVEFFTGDARELRYSEDVVIANLPYGLRMGSPRKVAKLYAGFERALASGSWRTAVLLTARPELYPAEPDEMLRVTLGTLPAKVMVFRN